MGSSVILPTPGQPPKGPDPGFKSGSIPNVVSFAFDNVGPPSTLYVQRDDVLAIHVITSAAAETIGVSARFLLPYGPIGGQPDAQPGGVDLKSLSKVGTIVTLQSVFNATNFARGDNQFLVPLYEGYLLSLTLKCSAALERGQTFAFVVLKRANFPAPGNDSSQALVADYVTASHTIGWPGGRYIHPSEGPGFPHSLQVANPAAGADWILNVPVQTRLTVRSFTAILTTSAAVANRNVELIVDDGANVYWRTSAPASVAATTVQQISGNTTNNPTGVITTDFSLLLVPNLTLTGGQRLRVLTTNLQAADQWSAIFLGVEEWIDLG